MNWLIIIKLNKINTFTLFFVFLAHFLILWTRVSHINLNFLCQTTIYIITLQTFSSVEWFMITSIVVTILTKWIYKILNVWGYLLINATLIYSLVWIWKLRCLLAVVIFHLFLILFYVKQVRVDIWIVIILLCLFFILDARW